MSTVTRIWRQVGTGRRLPLSLVWPEGAGDGDAVVTGAVGPGTYGLLTGTVGGLTDAFEGPAGPPAIGGWTPGGSNPDRFVRSEGGLYMRQAMAGVATWTADLGADQDVVGVAGRQFDPGFCLVFKALGPGDFLAVRRTSSNALACSRVIGGKATPLEALTWAPAGDALDFKPGEQISVSVRAGVATVKLRDLTVGTIRVPATHSDAPSVGFGSLAGPSDVRARVLERISVSSPSVSVFTPLGELWDREQLEAAYFEAPDGPYISYARVSLPDGTSVGLTVSDRPDEASVPLPERAALLELYRDKTEGRVVMLEGALQAVLDRLMVLEGTGPATSPKYGIFNLLDNPSAVFIL